MIKLEISNSLSELTAAMVVVGEPLKWDIFDMRKQLLLAKGAVIRSASQLDALLERGLCVNTLDLNIKPDAPPRDRFDPFWLWSDIRQQLGRLSIDYVEKRETDHATLVARMMELIVRIENITDGDPDAAIFELMQMDLTNYVVCHNMQIVFLCGLIARRLNMPDEKRHSLCRAAGTMNIACFELHSALSMQKEPLTGEQRKEIAEHPSNGAAHLIRRGVTDKDWIQAVADHHLAYQGEGQGGPSLMAQIIRTADLYLAKISPRSYRPAKSAAIAAKEIMTDKTVNPKVAAILVKELGIYPPGTYVRLANGDSAIVLRRGEKAQSPQVCSLSGGNGMPFIEPMPRNTADPKFAVTSVIPRNKIMVTINRAKIFNYRGL